MFLEVISMTVLGRKSRFALALFFSFTLQSKTFSFSVPSWNVNCYNQKKVILRCVEDRRSFLSVATGAPTWAQMIVTGKSYKPRDRIALDSGESNRKKGTILLLHESNQNPARLESDLFRTISGNRISQFLSEDSKTTPLRLDLDIVTMPCDNSSPSELSNIVNELRQQSKDDSLAVVGMGFGGTLALYTALQCLLPSSIPPPVTAISINGFLDLKWGIEQGHFLSNHRRLADLEWVHESQAGIGNTDLDFANRSPIDMLPPVSKNLRQQAVAIAGHSVTPPNCSLGLIHSENNPAIAPIEHSTRFTVASCIAGIEVDFHHIKQQLKVDDCFNPESTSWKIAKTTLLRELARGRRSPQNIDDEKMLIQPPLMKPTVRIESDKEILIQTRQASPLYV